MRVPLTAFEAARACEPDVSRYALGYVAFDVDENGVACAAATNGRMVICLGWTGHDAEPGMGPVLVPMDVCRVAAEIPRRYVDGLLGPVETANVTFADGRVTITAADNVKTRVEFSANRMAGGKFPRWREVEPEPAEGDVHIRISVKLLMAALRAIAAHVPSDLTSVTLTVRDAETPLVVTAATPERRAEAVIMPISGDQVRQEWSVAVKPKEDPQPAPESEQEATA